MPNPGAAPVEQRHGSGGVLLSELRTEELNVSPETCLLRRCLFEQPD